MEERASGAPSALASGIGWALVLWLAGGLITNFVCGATDAAWIEVLKWPDGVLHSPAHAPGLVGLALMLLQWVGAFALVLLLGVAELLAALVREAHIHHILPVLGFLFGISSRALAGGFGRVGVALGATAALFGVSALEVFTARGSRNKAWAAFPWLFVGILAGAAAFVRPHPTRSVAAPGVEEVVRYTPTSSWVDSRAGRGIAAQLTAVELAGDRLTTRLSFVNMSAVPVRFHVHRGLNLKSGASGALATVEVFTPVGDDGRLAPDQWVVLAAYGRPGSSLEAAYYFLRPKNPYCHWRLYLAAHSGNDPTMLRWDDFFWVEPFEFDITDTASHG